MKLEKILVTGASRGIGKATAMALLQRGYHVVLHASSEQSLAALQTELGDYSDFSLLPCDFSDPESVATFLKTMRTAHSDLFGVICNAGIALDKPIAYQPVAEIDTMLQVNLRTPLLLGKTCMKLFLKSKRGVFITLGSCVGTTGNAHQSVYSATKAALVAVSKSWAREIGTLCPDHAVRFVTVSPGFIETEMTDRLPETIRTSYRSQIPANRFGTAQEVASTICFLVSPAAPYINGTEININGGLV